MQRMFFHLHKERNFELRISPHLKIPADKVKVLITGNGNGSSPFQRKFLDQRTTDCQLYATSLMSLEICSENLPSTNGPANFKP